MAEEQRDQRTPAANEAAGLGLGALSMNVVAASATQEPSEAGRRAGRTWLILVGVVIVVAFAAFLGRSLGNLSPGKEAELRLRTRLQALPAWQVGVLQSARYIAGNDLRVDFSTQLMLADSAAHDQIKDTAIAVMEILIEERPNRDLHIAGYQGDRQILRAEYRRRKLVDVHGRVEPEILVHFAGEEGGLVDAMSESSPGVQR